MVNKGRRGAWLLVALLAGCTPPTAAGPVCGATPPPDDCCAILWGSIHGTVTDPSGIALSGADVTLKSRTGVPLGNCQTQLTVKTDEAGYYQFDIVPFDVPVEVTVVPPGRSSGQSKQMTVPRGPMVFADFAF